MKKYYLAVIEIFNTYLYGMDDYSSKNIEYYLIVRCAKSITNFNNTSNYMGTECAWKNLQCSSTYNMRCIKNSYSNNPLVKDGFKHITNIDKILDNKNYYCYQLVTIDVLTGGEMVGYPIGTFWIKIFQRKIRNILKQKYEKVKYYKNIKNSLSREIGYKYK